MDGKPFEILAECEMPAFPTGADIARVMDQIESARRSRPEVVRTTVNPPAIYRERRYVLPTRLVVWAEDAAGALRAAAEVLANAGLLCRTILPSSRAVGDAEAPPPPEPVPPGRLTARRRAPATGRPTGKRRRRPRTPAPKGAARRRTRHR
jgi:hypothetical protein